MREALRWKRIEECSQSLSTLSPHFRHLSWRRQNKYVNLLLLNLNCVITSQNEKRKIWISASKFLLWQSGRYQHSISKYFRFRISEHFHASLRCNIINPSPKAKFVAFYAIHGLIKESRVEGNRSAEKFLGKSSLRFYYSRSGIALRM